MESIKSIIGSPARGEKYFQRNQITHRIYEELDEGGNILISAPRRVGKTSIILNIKDNPKDGYYVVYVDTEYIDSSNTFFKKLLDEILDSDLIEKYDGFGSSVIEMFKQQAAKIKGLKVAGVGIDLKDQRQQEIDYYELFLNFLEEIDLEDRKILLLIDEFPVTIENIFNKVNSERKDEKEAKIVTKRFLQLNRGIRQNPKLSKKIQFLYTGSIGLFTVVSKLESTEDINDLIEIKVEPLDKWEAVEFANALLANYGIAIELKLIEYTLKKIEWLMPFYIQLIVREVRDLHRKGNRHEINQEFIDEAFHNLINNINIYFDHFRTRLNKVFSKQELLFAKELLVTISNKNEIATKDIPELAAKYQLEESFHFIIDTLIYDGYINNSINDEIFRFNSPILRLWWKKYGNK